MNFFYLPQLFYHPINPIYYSCIGLGPNLNENAAIGAQDENVNHSRMENQVSQENRNAISQRKGTLKRKRKRRGYKEYEYGLKPQKDDRNSFSNSLKIFQKFLRDIQQTNPGLLEQIIHHNVPNYSVQVFLSEFQKLIPKKSTYIGAHSTRLLTRADENNTEFSIVFRIMLKNFYQKEMYPSVLTSKKIIGNDKGKQLREGRKVYEKLIERKEKTK